MINVYQQLVLFIDKIYQDVHQYKYVKINCYGCLIEEKIN
jgi:hypothetical protein